MTYANSWLVYRIYNKYLLGHTKAIPRAYCCKVWKRSCSKEFLIMYHNVEMYYLQLCKTSQTKTKQHSKCMLCYFTRICERKEKLELRSIYSIDYLYLLNENPVLQTIWDLTCLTDGYIFAWKSQFFNWNS